MSEPSARLKPTCFQELILTLQDYWARQGCLILQPFDMEMGAGTFHTATTLRALGPKPLAAWGTGRPIHSTRTDADYKRIVETLIVPAYNGAPAPRLRWETTRGAVDTDLDALDTPLATDYLLSLVAKGAMRHIRFDRVVPNFVAQQRSVLVDEPLQRDEISRGRLTRGNLSWGTNIGNASRFRGTRGPGAAYDTGPADYTFAQTPQPHNEGDFSALGRIVGGMDVVDRLELGDYVKSVRLLKPGAK